MSDVTTVTGAIAADDLGDTLVLEHLLADFTRPDDPAAQGPDADAPLTIERLGDITVGGYNRQNLTRLDEQLAASELELFAQAGGRTVVDATSIGLGRDPQALARLSARTGVRIVMGSGWHRPSPDTHGRDAASLADAIVGQLRDGVDGIRAGVVGRLAALEPAIPEERALLAAAARASAATGAPIVLDLPAAAHRSAVFELLAGEGASTDRIALAGCGALSTDPAALLDAAATGAFLLFDRIGRLTSVYTQWDDPDVASAVRSLADAGHATQILLSPGIIERVDLRTYGGGGYELLYGPYRQFLAGHGIDDDLFRTITTDNTRRYLTGVSA